MVFCDVAIANAYFQELGVETKGRGQCRPSVARALTGIFCQVRRTLGNGPCSGWEEGPGTRGTERLQAGGAGVLAGRAGGALAGEGPPGSPTCPAGRRGAPGLAHLPSRLGSWSGPVPTWCGLESGAAGRSSRPRFHPFPMWSGRAEGCKVWQPCPAPLAPTSTSRGGRCSVPEKPEGPTSSGDGHRGVFYASRRRSRATK